LPVFDESGEVNETALGLLGLSDAPRVRVID